MLNRKEALYPDVERYMPVYLELEMTQTNYLYGIFWDYPQFTGDGAIVELLARARGNGDAPLLRWIMARFLEHGRATDTFRFFSVEEIGRHLPELRLRACTRKKWQRMIEVYRAP